MKRNQLALIKGIAAQGGDMGRVADQFVVTLVEFHKSNKLAYDCAKRVATELDTIVEDIESATYLRNTLSTLGGAPDVMGDTPRLMAHLQRRADLLNSIYMLAIIVLGDDLDTRRLAQEIEMSSDLASWDGMVTF